MGRCGSCNNEPSSDVVGVPVGVNVDLAHAHILLFALIGVDVMISKNNTPSHSSVATQENNTFPLIQRKNFKNQCFTCKTRV